jgi:hypothetical protein
VEVAAATWKLPTPQGTMAMQVAALTVLLKLVESQFWQTRSLARKSEQAAIKYGWHLTKSVHKASQYIGLKRYQMSGEKNLFCCS